MQFTFPSGGRPIRLTATEPATPNHPAILLLHGAGGNIDFWLDRISPFIARLGIAVYAVHYFDRTGTQRADAALLSDGRHVPLWLETISDTLTHIAQRPNVDAHRIALVGISLGAFLALALGAENPSRIRALVDVSGGLVPPYDSEATKAFPPTLILHGDSDTVVPVAHARNLDATLTCLAVPHTLSILQDEGHWFSPAAQARILGAVACFLNEYL